LPLILIWLLVSGQMWQLRTKRLKSHATRSAMGMLGMLANFGATILLPLAVATILGFTTPLFGVVLSAIVLKSISARGAGWRWCWAFSACWSSPGPAPCPWRRWARWWGWPRA
jgi:drug/metabolite transporter (DMT)-like permease